MFGKPSLLSSSLPFSSKYGQVGVGIPDGLESAIHIAYYFISVHGADDSLALLKVDIMNVFIAQPFFLT